MILGTVASVTPVTALISSFKTYFIAL
jgi:hypothetical protein